MQRPRQEICDLQNKISWLLVQYFPYVIQPLLLEGELGGEPPSFPLTTKGNPSDNEKVYISSISFMVLQENTTKGKTRVNHMLSELCCLTKPFLLREPKGHEEIIETAYILLYKMLLEQTRTFQVPFSKKSENIASWYISKYCLIQPSQQPKS